MPRYRYTGDDTRTLVTVTTDAGETAVCAPGDVITTADTVEHPLLELVPDTKPSPANAADTKEA